MKANASAALLIAVLALPLPFGVGAIPTVELSIGDSDIGVDESFDMDVFVDGVDLLDEVFAFGFDLDLPASWSLTGAQIGPAFDYDDSTLFPGTFVAGSVDFLNTGPNGDDILLATLTFTGSVAGTFNLGITSDLLDPNEGLFTIIGTYDLTQDAQVVINPRGSAPLPGSAWLLAAGIAALIGIAQKRGSWPKPPKICSRPQSSSVYLSGSD